MTETKTKTLVDVLKDLSSLSPERFTPIPSKQNIRVTYGGSSRPVYLPSINASHHAHVLYACMEECEARGWDMMMVYDADSNHWSVNIQDWVQYRGDNDFEAVEIAAWDAPDLADALATALRDALEAEL